MVLWYVPCVEFIHPVNGTDNTFCANSIIHPVKKDDGTDKKSEWSLCSQFIHPKGLLRLQKHNLTKRIKAGAQKNTQTANPFFCPIICTYNKELQCITYHNAFSKTKLNVLQQNSMHCITIICPAVHLSVLQYPFLRQNNLIWVFRGHSHGICTYF